MGETVRRKLFGGQEPLGEKIRLQKLSCEVIGLLEPKGQSTMGTDQDLTFFKLHELPVIDRLKTKR